MKTKSFWATGFPLTGISQVSVELDGCPHCNKRPPKECEVHAPSFQFDTNIIDTVTLKTSEDFYRLMIDRYDLGNGITDTIVFRGSDPLIKENAKFIAQYLRFEDQKLINSKIAIETCGRDVSVFNGLLLLKDNNDDPIDRIDRVSINIVIPKSRDDKNAIKHVQHGIDCLTKGIDYVSDENIDKLDLIVTMTSESSLSVLKEIFDNISSAFSQDVRVVYARGAALSAFDVILRPIGTIDLETIVNASKIITSDDVGLSQGMLLDQSYISRKISCPYCLLEE